MAGLKRIAAPVDAVLTLAEAKAHVNVEISDDDAYITSLISVATEMLEARLARPAMTQQFEMTLDSFPEDGIELSMSPVTTVDSVVYQDADGATQTLATSVYAVDLGSDQAQGKIYLKYDQAWPETREIQNAVKVTYRGGYLTVAELPAAYKHWVKIQLATLYKEREYTTDKPINKFDFTNRLLDSKRMIYV